MPENLIFDVRTVDLISKSRFYFVSNDQLKEDLSIAAQYISFMFRLSNEYLISGSVKYSIYKTIVIYAASITEGLLCYGLKDVLKIKTSKIKEYKNIKKIHPLENGDQIIWGIEKLKNKSWKETTFRSLNGKSKTNNIINESLFKKCESLREKRNKIHIADLSKGEDQFSIEEIDEIFETLAEIIEAVESLKQ